ncbi:uncharacterized protein [Arachis hypogaea]
MMAETIKYTDTLKENKERFADQWVVNHYSLEAPSQQSQPNGDDGNNSAASVVDPDMVWREEASTLYKNLVYRLGSFFTDNLRTSTLKYSSTPATSQSVDPEDGVDLSRCYFSPRAFTNRLNSCGSLRRSIRQSSHT